MEITKDTTYQDIKNNVNEINQKAWKKILKQELGHLKTFLEYEIDNIDSIIHSSNKQFIDNNIIDNLEYIINDIGHYYAKDSINGYSEITDTDFQSLETILKEIKGHD